MADPNIETLRALLSRRTNKKIHDPSLRPAGVAVLVYPKDGEYRVLLTRRTRHVESHKGEVSFPGGVKDDDDRSLKETALREAHEEMGIDPGDVDVLGGLDDVAIRTGYLITPFVGTIPSPYAFRPSEREVAEVLEPPLSALRSDGCHRDDVRVLGEELVYAPCYAYQKRLIHGATARVLQDLLRTLEGV